MTLILDKIILLAKRITDLFTQRHGAVTSVDCNHVDPDAVLS